MDASQGALNGGARPGAVHGIRLVSVTDPHSAPTQQSLQLILARNLLSTLSSPAFIVDPDQIVVFYNDAAGNSLGIAYEETGKMPVTEWRARMGSIEANGNPIVEAELPTAVAQRERRPVHTTATVRIGQEDERVLEMLALPLIGPNDTYEGAVGIFWPRDAELE